MAADIIFSTNCTIRIRIADTNVIKLLSSYGTVFGTKVSNEYRFVLDTRYDMSDVMVLIDRLNSTG